MNPSNDNSPRPGRPKVGRGRGDRGVRAARIRTGCNPYAQVALTYFHYMFSSVGAGITTCAALALLIIVGFDR